MGGRGGADERLTGRVGGLRLQVRGGRDMHLEQTTMFGVRGERVRISKRSPFGRSAETLNVQAERAETMRWKCLDCGHAWRDLRECGPVCRSGCPACRSLRIMDCNVGISARGGAEGAELIDLALWVSAAAVLLLLVVSVCGVRVRVTRETVYPDPVCERCGKILDGTSAVCAEEGN